MGDLQWFLDPALEPHPFLRRTKSEFQSNWEPDYDENDCNEYERATHRVAQSLGLVHPYWSGNDDTLRFADDVAILLLCLGRLSEVVALGRQIANEYQQEPAPELGYARGQIVSRACYALEKLGQSEEALRLFEPIVSDPPGFQNERMVLGPRQGHIHKWLRDNHPPYDPDAWSLILLDVGEMIRGLEAHRNKVPGAEYLSAPDLKEEIELGLELLAELIQRWDK